MTKEETFYIEEYKSLRQEMTTKLKDRLEFNRWGLIGLAALYSYIFSNPAKPMLFWVPVLLSAAMIAHLNEEHRMVDKAATYIREKVEPWGSGGPTIPPGWEWGGSRRGERSLRPYRAQRARGHCCRF